MARGFPVASCFWQGSTERSRPFPTNQPIGCKYHIKPKKVFRQSEPPFDKGGFAAANKKPRLVIHQTGLCTNLLLLPAQFVDLILQKLGDRAAGVAQTVDRGCRGRVVHGLCLGLDAQTLGGLFGRRGGRLGGGSGARRHRCGNIRFRCAQIGRASCRERV